MNDKIKELALDARLDMCGCGCNMPTRQVAKFAELIIKECIMLCEEWIEIDKDFKQDKANVGIDTQIGPGFCIDSIKNHFGVK